MVNKKKSQYLDVRYDNGQSLYSTKLKINLFHKHGVTLLLGTIFIRFRS